MTTNTTATGTPTAAQVLAAAPPIRVDGSVWGGLGRADDSCVIQLSTQCQLRPPVGSADVQGWEGVDRRVQRSASQHVVRLPYGDAPGDVTDGATGPGGPNGGQARARRVVRKTAPGKRFRGCGQHRLLLVDNCSKDVEDDRVDCLCTDRRHSSGLITTSASFRSSTCHQLCEP
jgi:hypothetical protein